MLKIKPNCELCDKELAPDSSEARICTYECTFCAGCVDKVLHNVCPNCGGGFVPRPIRPQNEYRSGVSLEQHPASKERVLTKYSRQEITDFVEKIINIAPDKR